MALSYFNRNVYYKTIEIGNRDFLISNVVLEVIPLLQTFISATEHGFKSVSILNYFIRYFDGLDKDTLYKYLERIVKVVHRLTIEKYDNTFLYFLYLLRIPRKVLSHTHFWMIKQFEDYSSGNYDEDDSIEMLLFYLNEDPINIEESIQYYMDLIRWSEENRSYDMVNALEEAAEIYKENNRYDLFFLNYTNEPTNEPTFIWGGKGIIKYLGIKIPGFSGGNNTIDHLLVLKQDLPVFIIHNYHIICGDVFNVHGVMLDELPNEIKDKLLNNKDGIYDTHLGKERSNDMKEFLSSVYRNIIDFPLTKIHTLHIVLLLIDLGWIYKHVWDARTYIVYTDGTRPEITVQDFIKVKDIKELKYYIRLYTIVANDDIEDLWITIKLLRKNGNNSSAGRLYSMMVRLVYPKD